MRKHKRLITVHAMHKTLELLELLAAGNEQLPIGALAHRLEMGRADVLLLLVTLESRGIMLWDERQRLYRPGHRAGRLARHLQSLSGLAVADSRELPSRSNVTQLHRREPRLVALP